MGSKRNGRSRSGRKEEEKEEGNQAVILTNEQFDEFTKELLEDPKPLSPKIIEAAKALDDEGIVFVKMLKPKSNKHSDIHPDEVKEALRAGYRPVD